MNNNQYTDIPGGFKVPKNDSHIACWQVECGRLDHDSWTQEQLLPYIKSCKTILDGGAFNGDHTIFYSKIVGKEGRVLAVEAGDVAFKALDHNTSQFEHNNVEVLNGALWDIDGHMLVHNPHPNSISMLGSVR